MGDGLGEPALLEGDDPEAEVRVALVRRSAQCASNAQAGAGEVAEIEPAVSEEVLDRVVAGIDLERADEERLGLRVVAGAVEREAFHEEPVRVAGPPAR